MAMYDERTDATQLLETYIGMPVNSMRSFSHVYPVFLTDGVWLTHEPTLEGKLFTIVDVYETSYVLERIDRLFVIGQYCQGIRYRVPTDISNRFPNVRMGWSKNRVAQMVYFK